MSSRKKPQKDSRFQVGRQFSFLFGRSRLKGVIVGDRGAIGVGERHLFRIEAPLDSEPPWIMEMPADDLQPA